MLTRRDFEKLATVIRDQIDALAPLTSEDVALGLDILYNVASDIADVCEGSNSRFDRETFLAACGF